MNSRLPLCSFQFVSCKKHATVSLTARNYASVCLPYSSSSKREGYTVNTYFYVVKDLCRIKLCSLQISDTVQLISYINIQFRHNKTTWHNPDNVTRAQSSCQFAMNSTKKSSNYTYPIRKKNWRSWVFFLRVRQYGG